MGEQCKVVVKTEEDEIGQVVPKEVKWKDGSTFAITRILHVSLLDNNLIRYTVLFGSEQRFLTFNGETWDVSKAS